jgi:two-component system CheB/CheR fusion protein
MGDFDQLRLLFFHLVENAIKFRSDADPVIDITAEKVEGMLDLSIASNGIEVSERKIDDVFTIFKRLGVKSGVPGAGVGLAICRRIALRHHGRIWMKPGKNGVTVGVRLRLDEESDG